MQPISSDDTHSKHKNIFEGRYFRFTKRLLWTAGLWPGQPVKQKAFRVITFLIVSLIVMAAQVLAMVKAWGQFNLFAECFTPVVANFGGYIKIFSCLHHSSEMKHLFDQMQKDWDDMQHSPRIKILEKFAEKGRLWTVFYFTMIYSIVFGWVIMALTPRVLDVLKPLNYSRPTFELFPVDFMVDPDVYFFPIIGFVTFVVCLVLLVFVAIDTLYMVLALHVCGEFEILRYNLCDIIKNEESTDVILKPHIDNDVHYHEIILCIKKHKIIIEHIKKIESTCEWKLVIVVGLSMLSLSFTGYVVIATRDDGTTMDTLRFVFFGIAQIFHLFCNTIPGHWILDSSSYVPNYVYSCHWYSMSLRSRKLILFLIRASIEPCKITAGKIYVMSMENFSAVLQTSMSYLTMLNSMQ